MLRMLLFFFIVFISTQIAAQKITPAEYISTYKNLAISEMQRSGVPASITLAQGILESESGNSNLAKKSNNHFGIKCKNDWTGEKVYHDDDERGECFRKYSTPEESYRDHSDFLKNRSHYSFLFTLDPADYKSWAYGLKKAGYATNPKYPELLIKTIEQYQLSQYQVAASEKTEEAVKSETVPPTESIQNPENENHDRATQSVLIPTKYNGTKAVFATKGTSLLAIATQFDIDLSKLMKYNNLSTDGLLDKDGWIYLQKNNLSK
ncbi:MAG: hemagglutinin [Ferruginibacter sp.]|nr:hemagglutinin [Ferruginibacter sp.]